MATYEVNANFAADATTTVADLTNGGANVSEITGYTAEEDWNWGITSHGQ